MREKDLYAVLGVGRGADDKELKSAYRKLAKKYHPDMNPGDKGAEQKFKEATEAYNILSDKEKRKLYDQYGWAAFAEGAASSGARGAGDPFGGFAGSRAGGGGHTTWYATGGNADDILRSLFGDLFGGRGAAGGTGTGAGRDGFRFDFGGAGFGDAGFGGADSDDDVYLDAKIPFTVAALGGEIKVRILEETLICRIPAGIQAGKKIRLRGKGYPRRTNPKERGDAYIVVRIDVPQDLTPAEKAKLREFAAMRKEHAPSGAQGAGRRHAA